MSEYKEGDRVLVDDVDGSTGFIEVEITAVEYNYFNDLRYRAGKRNIHPEEIRGYAHRPVLDEPNERANILNTAKTLINGDRAKDYGDPNENFGRIANLWNAQFAHKLAQPFTAQDVAYALIHLKMSRLANTPGHRDSLIDVCGYAALSGELK